MKTFITPDFLLQSATAQKLYHQYAADLPIIDFHNHLSPGDIANNRQYKNITEAWLEGDHYKWRALRTNGVNEAYITGNKSPEEKFKMWGKTVPDTFRNPLFHWTHLELQRYFGINDLLNEQNAELIYKQTSEMLQSNELNCGGILKKMNVKVVCTTDDPADSLEHHIKIRDQNLQVAEAEKSTQVRPTFRPDKLYAIHDTDAYLNYLQKLRKLVGFPITRFHELLEAIKVRIDFFHDAGCRLADHGLEQLYLIEPSRGDASQIFKRLQEHKKISQHDQQQFTMTLLYELSKMYHAKGWTQQYHLGAIRNNNTRLLQQLGPDTGFDSIGDFSQTREISTFLNRLDQTDQLAKTILYNLNPRDNEAMAAMIGNFNDGSIPGKIQYGSGWWFLDQKDGMEKQMNALSNIGLLSRFVGMVTDSRSFLSFPRHEYFRRILCNLIGRDVENGELPDDQQWLGAHIQNICYYNAKNYFDFND